MKLIASAAVLVLMSLFWTFFNAETPYEQTDTIGQVTIVVIDESGTRVIEDVLSFKEEDTLLSLLDERYTISYSNTSIGRILINFDPVETDFEMDYIQIRITGILPRAHHEDRIMAYDLSPVGIDLIPLVDGNTYYFIYQKIGS